MTRAKTQSTPRAKISKHEIRNSKQIQMTRKKRQNVPNNPDWIRRFGISLSFDLFGLLCFGFQASDFGF
jgi:hypothetical protein